MKERQDIWQTLYETAKREYAPAELTPFVCARHVVSAIEAEDGQIFTGFCVEGLCGTMNLCAERAALLNMYAQSGQTRAKRVITFRDRPPYGSGSGMPCGVCREFFYQLNEKNKDTEFLVDYAARETVTLKELLPDWWGQERSQEEEKQTSM
ncbi:cytidine deaminase family protein [Suipraeoptans intestinalis]|uniref:cytidine deaminase family protein n=1 Tax=Suipraeoptans intestinalis TaxID=2606628 RepID=UPI0023F261F8|nr:cytidine deaminase [Suipraeoptans intestinalis]MDD7769755.1 cytidine deaminase [Suipraeoptans intestinalis]MDY3121863.1 cytidine deaminase [Suipraeoptans intestinalis]